MFPPSESGWIGDNRGRDAFDSRGQATESEAVSTPSWKLAAMLGGGPSHPAETQGQEAAPSAARP